MSDSILAKSKDAVVDGLSAATQALGISSAAASNIYVDESLEGTVPESAPTGTQSAPYSSLQAAVLAHGLESIPTFLVKKAKPAPGEETVSGTFDPITGAGAKKAKKAWDTEVKRKEKEEATRAKREKEDEEKRVRQAKQREEASKIVLSEPEGADKATRTKIKHDELEKLRDQRIRVFGWVHRLRVGKDNIFMDVRDGSGYLQVVLSGPLTKTIDALDIVRESTVEITGTLKVPLEGKTAEGGHELIADWWETIGTAPGGEEAFVSRVPDNIELDRERTHDPDIRHLAIRTHTAASVIKVRGAVLREFRRAFDERDVLEVTPPAMVQTSVEGGSTLFVIKYYNEDAYLTQSSQLYLETCLPSLGDVYCIQESFRAENSHTRRHLAEYTHLEAELAFINFDQLMDHIEAMICTVIDRLLADPKTAALIKFLNPEFKTPVRPFKRMEYRDAIKYCIENDILCEDEETHEMRPHRVGDDIAEAAERRMTDQMGVPVFLTRFPKEIKAFYMKKCPGDEEYTESVDLLMPGVGEIVGGSMRITDLAELFEGYKRENIDPAPYYWFTDQRKYGTCEHGGYGLGVERLLAWICHRWTVRDCSLYPRWPGRAKP